MYTFEQQAMIVSAVMGMLAFLLEAIPQLNRLFDRFTPKQKQGVFIVVNLAVVIGLTFYGCRSTVGITVDCITADLWLVVGQFLGLNGVGLGVSQGVHKAFKTPA